MLFLFFVGDRVAFDTVPEHQVNWTSRRVELEEPNINEEGDEVYRLRINIVTSQQ